ncbi:MAG: hypothetical protein FWB80_15430 [Defluviitaleaceae bacterium]|nr:hypothetical protein [Defluviitaleaceae bacterium]
MTDREIKKQMADKLFEYSVLMKAPAEKRETIIKNHILQAKASMTAEEVSHVLKMVEDAEV